MRVLKRSRTLHRTMRSARGQTSAEYLGVLLLVVAVVFALAHAGVGSTVSCGLRTGIAHIAGGDPACGDAAQTALGARDTDGDGIPDDVEQRNGTDPKNADSDDDGVNDADESRRGTDPLAPDTDGDGLTDAEEGEHGTDPRNADTDRDGLPDIDEVDSGSDPKKGDSDGDGLSDQAERNAGTDPLDE